MRVIAPMIPFFFVMMNSLLLINYWLALSTALPPGLNLM